MAQRFAQQLGIHLGVKLGKLGKAGGSLFSRVGFFAFGARGIVLENADRFSDVSFLDQIIDVGLHVAGRDAPRFVGEQDGALAAFRNCGPELAVQDFAVRFEDEPGVAHFVFMGAEDFAQVFDFLIHAVEHLAHGVDCNLAALETLEGEANGKMLGELNQDGLIGSGVGCFRGELGEGLLQNVLSASGQVGKFFVNRVGGACASRASCADLSKIRESREDAVHFRFAGLGDAAAWAEPRSESGTSHGWGRRSGCVGSGARRTGIDCRRAINDAPTRLRVSDTSCSCSDSGSGSDFCSDSCSDSCSCSCCRSGSGADAGSGSARAF